MAIYINHPNDPNGRVDAPEVRIAGKEVNTTDGTLDSITRIYSRDHQRVIGGSASQKTAKDVDHRASDAFKESVTVTINPDTAKGFHNNQAVWRKAVEDRETNDKNVFYGEQPGGLSQNETMYTYYTLNGKNPNRTKAELYTGPFTVRQNKSGGDNYVLKVRSYINGIASPVRRVDFRIVNSRSDPYQSQNNNLNVNRLSNDASAT